MDSNTQEQNTQEQMLRMDELGGDYEGDKKYQREDKWRNSEGKLDYHARIRIKLDEGE
ncbi:hypothetical protein ACLOJK_036660 [Asimina triloba]